MQSAHMTSLVSRYYGYNAAGADAGLDVCSNQLRTVFRTGTKEGGKRSGDRTGAHSEFVKGTGGTSVEQQPQ